MLEDPNHTSLVGVVFGAGGAGAMTLRYIVEAVIASRKSRARRKHIDGLKRITKIYDELNQIIAADSNINRVMVIRSSNSGSIPSPGCRIFIRVLHEAYRSLSDSIIHSNLWDERQADQHYISLVREVAQEGYVELKAANLPEESALRAVYDASHTECAKVFRLELTGTEMFYLSVNYRNDVEAPPISKAVTSNSVANLKTLFAS
jgi:hypothetical protein